MDFVNLNISSLNTHGIKGNLFYINKLCTSKNIDVLFICEHWLNVGYENLIQFENYNVHMHSAMENLNYSGRPYGGLMFICKNNINVISSEFLNDNVSLLKINQHDIGITIIGIIRKS
jgi:hypothetical protein